jgi:DNA repair exonuclease SbcCD ATPase subunit
MNETLVLLSKALPQLAIIAAVFGFLGWAVRGAANKPAPSKTAKPASTGDKAQADRAKKLEAALESSKAANKDLKTELESLKTGSVSKATFESKVDELSAARKAADVEAKRLATLETDLKKAQETIKQLNARANETDKAQKDRSIALENELSKVRGELATLQAQPDDVTALQTEIERLRESVAVSTRYAGEVRKREAAAIEALEKAEAKLADLSDPSSPAAVSQKVGPVGDTDRIAAAKAEVLRIIEANKQKAAAPVEAPVETIEEPVAIADVIAEVAPVVSEIEAPAAEKVATAE